MYEHCGKVAKQFEVDLAFLAHCHLWGEYSMSYYVSGSDMSYADYLTAKSFSDDIAGAMNRAGKEASNRISMEMSHQTREVIASNETLAYENIVAIAESTDRITGALKEGFERLSYEMTSISDGIAELNATFHWGFGEVIASLGHMNDTLTELVKIAKTPVQTVAFNHFDIARDAFRQQLYQECIEELEKAISGDHTSAGYKLEWRFHQMMGTVRLGFANCDMTLVDLTKAEEAFLLAARYGKTDYPEDAARAFLSAGWAAYCQGKLMEALAHTEQAIYLHPQLGEAFFQAAKIKMALGQVDLALQILSKAIDIEGFYALKAAGDGDFQKYNDRLCAFFETLRFEYYHRSVPKLQMMWDRTGFWREHSQEAKTRTEMIRIGEFLAEGEKWPLINILGVVKGLLETAIILEQTALNSIILVHPRSPVKYHMQEVEYEERENFMETVVIKSGGLFRREITEMRSNFRIVTKTRKVQFCDGVKHHLYTGSGDLLAQFEFCFIPAGDFIMQGTIPVTISLDFYLGKYPITQAQWQAVMGANPSRFIGANRPVETVSWKDCQAFIKKLNQCAEGGTYRLPTEPEWEYACLAGRLAAHSSGDYAWCKTNSNLETQPVGLKKPNAWDLFDMLGNVFEWCSDSSYQFSKDPVYSSRSDIKTLRGGSWKSDFVASKNRIAVSPNNSTPEYGFRLVALRR